MYFLALCRGFCGVSISWHAVSAWRAHWWVSYLLFSGMQHYDVLALLSGSYFSSGRQIAHQTSTSWMTTSIFSLQKNWFFRNLHRNQHSHSNNKTSITFKYVEASDWFRDKMRPQGDVVVFRKQVSGETISKGSKTTIKNKQMFALISCKAGLSDKQNMLSYEKILWVSCDEEMSLQRLCLPGCC